MPSGTDDFAVASKMSHAAPIVIDVRNDSRAEGGMTEREGFDLAGVQAMADRLPPSIPAARAAGVPVVSVRNVRSPEDGFHLSDAWPEQASRARGGSSTRREIRAEDSRGGDFFGGVSPQLRDSVVTRHRFDGFCDTDLDTIFRADGIGTTAFTGAAPNVCVETAARDAFMRDCCVAFATGGTANCARGDHDATLCNIDRCFGEFASVAEVGR